MTEELFRDDAALLECEATVLSVDEQGVVLDRTVFYPLGGGQAGDTGVLIAADGRTFPIADTRKHKGVAGAIAHVPAAPAEGLVPGTRVTARIDADRRRAHMRSHTAPHPLCALVPHPADGRAIPAGRGRVRGLEIDGGDRQPCGGTHVANTSAVGAVVVTKVEKKSAVTRRVVLGFADGDARSAAR